MKLIGMLDSPFVRRTAIGMQQLGLGFEHQSLSVFRDFETFKTINPFVKAPTLVLDSGEFLVDSNIILQYCEKIAAHSLFSDDISRYTLEQQIISYASIANEKTVQVVYEFEVRPQDKQHAPWLTRVTEQLRQSFVHLENLLSHHADLFDCDNLSHAAITTGVAWYFTTHMRPGLVDASEFPNLVAWSAKVEQTAAFKAFPYDESMSNG